MLNSIIIGPSGVGKTALVASVQHASNIVSFSKKKHLAHVVSKNAKTRDLFSQALSIVQEGSTPFAGTELSVCYDFTIDIEEIHTTWWSKILGMFGSGEYSGRFQFMDAPGGAVFDENIHARHAENANFQALIEQMLSSQGLIICIDMNNALLDKSECTGIQEYYLKSLQFFLTHGFSITVPIQRICFVFTKADMYAEKQGVTEHLDQFLNGLDYLSLVRHVIGDESIETLTTFLDEDAHVCFSATSTYGFYEGKSFLSVYKDVQALKVEQWRPYNVIESFYFLLTGEKHHDAQTVFSVDELKDKIKK